MWFPTDVSHIISLCILPVTLVCLIIYFSEVFPLPPCQVLIKDWYSDYRNVLFLRAKSVSSSQMFLLQVYVPLLRISIVLIPLFYSLYFNIVLGWQTCNAWGPTFLRLSLVLCFHFSSWKSIGTWHPELILTDWLHKSRHLASVLDDLFGFIVHLLRKIELCSNWSSPKQNCHEQS